MKRCLFLKCYQLSVTLNSSAKNLIKLSMLGGSIRILMISRFQNCYCPICLSWGFRNWPWSLNLMKNWLRYERLKIRLDFCRVSKKLKSSQFLKCFQLSLTLNNSAKNSSNQTGVSESSWQADFKTVIGCPIWPSIYGENTEMSCCILNRADCMPPKYVSNIYVFNLR